MIDASFCDRSINSTDAPPHGVGAALRIVRIEVAGDLVELTVVEGQHQLVRTHEEQRATTVDADGDASPEQRCVNRADRPGMIPQPAVIGVIGAGRVLLLVIVHVRHQALSGVMSVRVPP